MPTVQLTQSFINANLTCPCDKRVEYCDKEIPGLYVLVSPASQGRGTFYLRYKDTTSKTCHQRIGKTGEISLADARKEAKKLKAEIALGANPAAEAKAQKEVPTLASFFKEQYLPHAKSHKRSWKRDEELYRLRIDAAFGTLRLNQLSRQKVQVFHAGLANSGLSKATADHHIKVLRRALNLAVSWGQIEKNPISGIELFHANNQMENYMTEEELQRLLTVLRNDDNRTVCNIAMFLLSTGCRLNEALQAEWRQVDRANRVWRILAINSKSKRMRSVPLNDSALHVLDQLDTEGEFDHLFINRQTRLPYTTIMKVWARLRTKADLKHLRIHDLRHAFASLLVSAGESLFSVQVILGHSDPKVTQRYSHLSSKAMQSAASMASVLVPRQSVAAAKV
ncbi:site-specific integrase [Roseateles toxinivorans]|uniref:Site-specific recombinase XerD n=1 Tax=Roseateles toxinivorans TaxID=270368 RepID=A0A4R6QSP3_9BURK|nr:site-specific integrase [Roseateles toxinivorans]TDP74073.1 site-specific recombinase XerD [Roseateles toxinivorans]